jgi:clorobiocin biosynthesis protein CloN6
MVMRGYDTHEPMASLLQALKLGRGLEAVPNLLWKSADQTVHDNGVAHLPDSYSCGIDWSRQPRLTSSKTLPILEVLSTQNAGCAYNCPWCGGSREAFRRIYGRQNAMARKPREEIRYEIATSNDLQDVDKYHFYSIGSYNESPQGMEFFLDRIAESRFKSISYEQFHLTPDDLLKRMAKANPRTIITLSPESHDIRISKLAGRGVYTNDELERWIARAFEYGIFQIDVWYFVGMPQQDASSVAQTVDYCRRLLSLFKGQRLNPMVCPMIPFLDPASTFFVDPARHGYRVFHRSVEEHRAGMERASVLNRINYETEWLSRRDLVRVGFDAVKQVMEVKADIGQVPRSWVKAYNARVDDALEFIPVVHEADCIADPKARAAEIARLHDDIRRRNDQIFHAGVLNQAFPVNREIGGRWFDELGWDPHVLEAAGALAQS